MQSITLEKLKSRQPNVLVKPDLPGYRVLDFLKTEEILAGAEPLRETVKRQLGEVIEAHLKSAAAG